jgi:hypothetical protein
MRKTPPPYTPPRPRILSIIPPITAADYRLIVASRTKRRPSEAEDPPPSLFFDASSLGVPTKGTSRGKNEPTARRLQQTHGEPWHHDLGPWQMLPWRYGTKPLGVGRQRLILFLCVVFVCLVCACVFDLVCPISRLMAICQGYAPTYLYTTGGGGCISDMSICRKTQNRVNLGLKRCIFM